MRAAILPVRGCEPENLVTLRGPVAGRSLKVFPLHVQHHRAALVGQKVWDNEARGLTSPGRGHDEGMGKYL